MYEFEPRRIFKSYRLITNKDGQRLELTSNIASLEIAEELRQATYKRCPFFDNIQIEEYSTYLF